MKKISFIIIIISVMLFSCGGNSNESSSDKQNDISKEEADIEAKDFKKAKDCDEFIDQYEKWMDDYLALIEKYMQNPMDGDLMQQYTKVAQEGMNWMNQWNSKLIFCAGQEKYEKRFNEISERAEKKLEQMGIE